MARIRSTKPEFWTDRPFVRRVPNRDARMLYMALWNLADEHSRLGGDSYYIKSQVFPYAEDDDLTPDAIDGLLDMLARAGKIVRYEVDGDPYLHLPKLGKHQRLEPHKVPSRLPDIPEAAKFLPPPPAPPVAENIQASVPAQVRADESARDPDDSASDADSSALLYVAWSMEPVAGSMCGETRTDPDETPPRLATVPDSSADAPPQHIDPPETEGQRVNRLAKIYTDQVPLSKFLAVAGIVKKAVRANDRDGPLYTDQQITDALLKLVDEKRSVTTDTLRIALEGPPKAAANGYEPWRNPDPEAHREGW